VSKKAMYDEGKPMCWLLLRYEEQLKQEWAESSPSDGRCATRSEEREEKIEGEVMMLRLPTD
jgi:hypothetical protein